MHIFVQWSDPIQEYGVSPKIPFPLCLCIDWCWSPHIYLSLIHLFLRILATSHFIPGFSCLYNLLKKMHHPQGQLLSTPQEQRCMCLLWQSPQDAQLSCSYLLDNTIGKKKKLCFSTSISLSLLYKFFPEVFSHKWLLGSSEHNKSVDMEAQQPHLFGVT